MAENGRLIDIPYGKSPPVIFTYRQTATLAVGQYNFSGSGTTVAKQVFDPSRPLMPNALYLFETISFSMDVEPNDYQAAIATLPSFSAYLQSGSLGPALREPIVLDKYFENYPYRLHIMGALSMDKISGAAGDTFNKLFGSIGGVLNQTASLVGKGSITAVIKMTAQEVTDGEFISAYTHMGQEARAIRNQGRQF